MLGVYFSQNGNVALENGARETMCARILDAREMTGIRWKAAFLTTIMAMATSLIWVSSLFKIYRLGKPSVRFGVQTFIHSDVAPCGVTGVCRRTWSRRVYSGLMTISG